MHWQIQFKILYLKKDQENAKWAIAMMKIKDWNNPNYLL